MATAAVGNLRVNLTAHTAKFKAGMKSAGGFVSKFSTGVGKAKAVLGSFGGILGAVSVGGLVAFAKRSANAYDALGKFADRLHINVEELQRLRHVADLTGAGADTLGAGLETLAKRLGEARRGTGAATAALKELGLSAKTLSAMSPDKAFMRIAVAMEKIHDPGQRAAIVANLFSKANMALLGTLDQGAAAIKRMGDELDNTLSRDKIRRIEELNDSMTRLKNNLAPLGGELAAMAADLSQMGKHDVWKKPSWLGGEGTWWGYGYDDPKASLKKGRTPAQREANRDRGRNLFEGRQAQLAARGQYTVDAIKKLGGMGAALGASLAATLSRWVPDQVRLSKRDAPGTPALSGAHQRGSAEAYSIIARTQMPMLQEAKERKRLLERILEALDFKVVGVD